MGNLVRSQASPFLLEFKRSLGVMPARGERLLLKMRLP